MPAAPGKVSIKRSRSVMLPSTNVTPGVVDEVLDVLPPAGTIAKLPMPGAMPESLQGLGRLPAGDDDLQRAQVSRRYPNHPRGCHMQKPGGDELESGRYREFNWLSSWGTRKRPAPRSLSLQ